MEIQQITANFPGKGNVDVLASPDLADFGQDARSAGRCPTATLGIASAPPSWFPTPTAFGASSRADGKTLTTEWKGQTITLPANNIGKNPGAERHAMHGLILKAKTDNVDDKKDSRRRASHRRHSCRRLRRPLALEDRPRFHHHASRPMRWMRPSWRTMSAAKRNRSPSDGTPTSTCLPATAPRQECTFPARRWPKWTTTTTSFRPES